MWAWKSRIGLLAMPGRLPDPRALGRCKIELVARLDLECRIPGVDVPDDAVYPELAPAVRIAGGEVADIFVGCLASPHLSPAKEHALVAGHPVDHWSRLTLERGVIGIETHGKPAKVGEVLAHGE